MTLAPPTASLLADDLRAAGYTAARQRSLVGVPADDALVRGDAEPARRALRADAPTPLATLIRLFVLGDAVPLVDAAAAFPGLGVDGASALGILGVDGASARALLAVRPYVFHDGGAARDGWIVSDLDELAGVSPLRPDHVLGVGGAARTLVSLLPPEGSGRALDLGCGCGVIALHLRRRGYDVVATDVSERALALTELNAALNGIDGVEVRSGSLFDPVAGETFDLIASNPPFVVTPRTEGVPAYEYRDGGFEGDGLMAAVARGIPAHLSSGGGARLLGNWEHRGGEAGLRRLARWLDGTDVGVWAIERERLDPVRYAELWIRDGGTRTGTEEHAALVDAWLDDFDARGVAEVGLGWVVLSRATPSLLRLEEVGQQVDLRGVGAHVAAALSAHAALQRADDADLRTAVLVVAPDVTEARHHLPGSDAPSVIELRQGGGLGRTVDVDPALAGLVGACDGELTVGAILDALAELLEVDGAALTADLLPRVRDLVFSGFLTLP